MASAGETPRAPHEVLLSAMADADAILQRLKSGIADGSLDLRDVLEVVGDWVDRASKLSKVVIDARLDERRVEVEERQGQMLGHALVAALAELAEIGPALRDKVIRGVLWQLGWTPEYLLEDMPGQEPAPVVVAGELG